MAAANEAGAAEGRGVHILWDVLQQVMQGIRSIQGALLVQERRLEDLERTRREDRQATAAGANECAGALAPGLEERLQRLEQGMEVMERSLPSEEQEGCQATGVEERMSHLEHEAASSERDLQSALPRVDALLNQLEKPSPPVTPPHPTSSSTSGAPSASPPAAPRSRPAGRVATPPLTRERWRELGEQLADAAEEGREDDIRPLLAEGADINYSRDGSLAPLIYAVCTKHKKITSLLIRRGANVNVCDECGLTALHYACRYDPSGRCASLLLRAGAQVGRTTCQGETPLHIAAEEGNEAAARALLAAGASKRAKDNDGNTPSECATNEDLHQLLRP